MHRLGYAVFLAAFTLLASLTSAFADLSGRYNETIDAATVIDIVQQGQSVTGTITGVVNGTLDAKMIEGKDQFEGTLKLEDGDHGVSSRWTREGYLELTVLYNGGMYDRHNYERAGASQQTTGTTTQVAAIDDMSGQYTGTGADTGTAIDIAQQGQSLTGKITGTVEGTLSARIIEGQNNLEGFVDLSTGIRYTFRGLWTAQSLVITLYDTDGATEVHSFVPSGTAGGIAEVSSTQYWVYDNDTQFGPLTLNEVVARIQRGESNNQTQVWTQELNEWVMIDQVPELAPALTTTTTTTQPTGGADYWTFDNGGQYGPFTLQQVLDRIKSGESNAGSQIWTQQLNAWVMIDKVPEFATALAGLPGGGKQYFVFDNNQQAGPLDFDAVVARLKSGESDRRTQVWTQQLNSWVLIDTQPEFAQALTDVPMPATEYFVFDNNQQAGPLSLEQVQARIKAGESNGQTQVWTQALNKWVMLGEVPELAAALTGTSTTTGGDVANYYLYADGQQSGPYTHEQMLLGIAQGTVPRGTLVWMPGWDEWQKVETIEEFAQQLPPAVPAAVSYYVIDEGDRLGPLTEAEMIDRITNQSTTGADLAWKKGLEAWAPVSDFPEFAEALALVEEAPPPVPVIEEDQPPKDDGPPPMPNVDDGTGDDQGGIEVVPGGDHDLSVPPVDDGDAVDAALLGLVNERILQDFAGKPEDQQDAAVSCVWGVLSALTKEEKQVLIDAHLRPTPEQVSVFEQSYPGITKNLDACGQEASISVRPLGDDDQSTVGDQPPVVGDQPPVIGDQPPVVGDQPPVVEDQPVTAGPLDATLREVYSAQLPDMASDVKPGVLDCLIKESAVLSDSEKQMVIDENASDATGDKLEVTHPGFHNALTGCIPSGADDTAGPVDDGQDTSATQPEVTTPGTNEDPLLTAIRDSFRKQGLPSLYLDSTAACVHSVLVSQLSEAERQTMTSGIDLTSAEQGAAMEAAHPGIQEQLAHCAPRTMGP
jgi:uncharacterized membrane protein